MGCGRLVLSGGEYGACTLRSGDHVTGRDLLLRAVTVYGTDNDGHSCIWRLGCCRIDDHDGPSDSCAATWTLRVGGLRLELEPWRVRVGYSYSCADAERALVERVSVALGGRFPGAPYAVRRREGYGGGWEYTRDGGDARASAGGQGVSHGRVTYTTERGANGEYYVTTHAVPSAVIDAHGMVHTETLFFDPTGETAFPRASEGLHMREWHRAPSRAIEGAFTELVDAGVIRVTEG